jgi:PAP2 superfamily
LLAKRFGRVALVVAAIAAAFALASPSPAHADTVTDWNEHACQALMINAGQPAFVAIHMAMVHGAVYDAVSAIDGGYQPYLSAPPTLPMDSKEAAAATAAYRVLMHLQPGQGTDLTTKYGQSLAAIPDGLSKTRGIAIGEQTAAAMILNRTGDGRFGAPGFTVHSPLMPGDWRPVLPMFVNDPAGWLRNVRPFMIPNATKFRSKGPNDLTSNKYAKEFNEVKSLGSLTSTTRTADQELAARYWAEIPPNTWSRIAVKLVEREGVSLVDNARFFAQVYMTASDAFITVWDSKDHYSFWRPITAIHEAANDGNPRTQPTQPNDAWRPLIANPPYPDEPSGHASLSASFVATLQELFGTDQMAWTDTNRGGFTRSFTSFSQAIEDVIDARVWSGIHFRTADKHGAKIGRQVAEWRREHYFQPRH